MVGTRWAATGRRNISYRITPVCEDSHRPGVLFSALLYPGQLHIDGGMGHCGNDFIN